MNKTILAILLLTVAPFATAQGFQDEPTCYSWNGGHKSAGSFTKCPQPFIVAKAPPAPPPPVVVPAPLMQNTVCPPQIILEPEPKRHVKRKPRPIQKCNP